MLGTFVLYNDLCVEIEVLKEQIKLTGYEIEYWLGIKMNDVYFNGIPLGAYGVHRFGVNTALGQAEEKVNTLNKLRERLDNLEQYKKNIETLLSKLEKLEYKVAYMRYVEGKSLKEISEELRYNYDYIRQIMQKLKRAV